MPWNLAVPTRSGVRSFGRWSRKDSDPATPLNGNESKEDKGIGINGWTRQGDLYSIGSFRMVQHFHADLGHSIYVPKNNQLLATADLSDEIKPAPMKPSKRLRGRAFG